MNKQCPGVVVNEQPGEILAGANDRATYLGVKSPETPHTRGRYRYFTGGLLIGAIL